MCPLPTPSPQDSGHSVLLHTRTWPFPWAAQGLSREIHTVERTWSLGAGGHLCMDPPGSSYQPCPARGMLVSGEPLPNLDLRTPSPRLRISWLLLPQPCASAQTPPRALSPLPLKLGPRFPHHALPLQGLPGACSCLVSHGTRTSKGCRTFPFEILISVLTVSSAVDQTRQHVFGQSLQPLLLSAGAAHRALLRAPQPLRHWAAWGQPGSPPLGQRTCWVCSSHPRHQACGQ